ncbi:MAG: M48 family metallopeptidase [Armatimonadetes bacterium]|nr:M48 family metallopeptidase [Armatimonadota bacterium]
MNNEATNSQRLYFPGIASSAFEHPLDRAALEALRRTPGFDRMLKMLSEWGMERYLRAAYTGDAIRVSPRQCSRLYKDLREACAVLDVAEPEFYLMQNPHPAVYFFGMQRHTIVLTTSLVDLMSDEERLALIGRELGHIKAEHMLYRTMAILLAEVLSNASKSVLLPGAILTEVVLYALFVWFRRSELTADRAGLLVSQDVDVNIKSLLKLVAGSQKLADDLDNDEFIKQADVLDDMEEDLISLYFKFSLVRWQTHPFPAYRAREIKEWSQSENYLRLLRGDYPRENTEAGKRVCTSCGAVVSNVTFRFCPECGTPMEPIIVTGGIGRN